MAEEQQPEQDVAVDEVVADEQQPEGTAIDEVVADAQRRIEKAAKGFDWLNQSHREGQPVYGPPPLIDLTAAIDTLTTVIVTAGLASVEELVAIKTVKLAEGLEQALANAKEHKRSLSGIVVPGRPAPPVPTAIET